jgi:hypothetical protein
MLDKHQISRIRINSCTEKGDPMGWFQKRERPASLKERFFSRDKSFQKMLADQATKTVEGIEALEKFTQNPNSENAKRVREIEQEADELRRVVVEELDKSWHHRPRGYLYPLPDRRQSLTMRMQRSMK